ncbi:GxxExxY protein [Levilinea saccharolytica]|nr:GxxExxY protein [Levilinea saccharolytica]GAP17534.1 GxxExxY protein [Levilinea saccharolytica]
MMVNAWPPPPPDELTGKIIGAAIEVHRHLGPGLLETAYERCLAYELRSLGLHVDEQLLLPLVYKDLTVETAYRIDLLVENQVLVELKVVEQLTGVHEAQILTYLKLADRKIGLLINFNMKILKHGIRRYVR